MSRLYKIYLDNNIIGTSELENADAPMGVVFGKISFVDNHFNFDFFNKYCKDNNIKADQYPEDKFISTQTIPNLKVLNENGIEIKGIGCYIGGMDSDCYDINIIGIPSEVFSHEFPLHEKAYREQFNQ